jgi:glycosyltransferase involved in cell wall biosynthesis
MRVLLLSHVSDLYGAGRSLLALAQGLQERGHVPLVIVPRRGDLSHSLASKEIDCSEIECPWWAYPPESGWRHKLYSIRGISRSAIKLRRVIRHFKPDIVHTNSAVIPSGALAARWAGIPHVWHLREYGVEDYGLRFFLGRAVSGYLVGLFSRAIVAISHSVAQAYQAPTMGECLRVVYNGVDWPADRPLPDRNPTARRRSAPPMLVLLGALHPAKGQAEAIQAAAELKRRGVRCTLRLVGGDVVGYRARLEELVQRLGISDQVIFAGYRPDPMIEFLQADVVLVCSRCEAFGRVIVEAMLAQRPIVAANTCGTLELIENDFNGVLYRAGDPVHLAERIVALLGDPAWARQLGMAAQQVARERFSMAQYVNGVESVYKRVLASE